MRHVCRLRIYFVPLARRNQDQRLDLSFIHPVILSLRQGAEHDCYLSEICMSQWSLKMLPIKAPELLINRLLFSRSHHRYTQISRESDRIDDFSYITSLHLQTPSPTRKIASYQTTPYFSAGNRLLCQVYG